MDVLKAAPIFGYLGDRYSRKYLMAIGVVIWASLSLTASFMPSYWYFVVIRALIAIGESAFTTIAPTVLGDLFTDETRSLVYGIFYTAIPIGSGLGFAVGNAPSYWRTGLRITPGLTFLAAVLILVFLYDPPRGESEGKTITNKSSYTEDLKYIGGDNSDYLKRKLQINLNYLDSRSKIFCSQCCWLYLCDLHYRSTGLVRAKLYK